MNHSRFKVYALIFISLLSALMLNIAPWPTPILFLRPLWVELCLFYWLLMLPETAGLLTSWSIGIVLDTLDGSLLGMHALGLIIAAYIISKYYRQIRMFPLWQQALVILVLLLVNQAMLFWLQAMLNQPHTIQWLGVFISALLWPPLVSLLRISQRHCGLSN